MGKPALKVPGCLLIAPDLAPNIVLTGSTVPVGAWDGRQGNIQRRGKWSS
jgi:hypothetical protein